MKGIFILGISIFIVLQINAQDNLKNFNDGLTLFNSGDYSAAIDQFSKAIKQNPNNKDCYFNRGASYLYLGDTCSACKDFHQSFQFGDLQARNLIEINCIKCDDISYEYYNKSLIAINNEKYSKADSLLTFSIENNHYLQNHFQRGILRFYLGDTMGFCSDMRSIYSLDEAPKINCQTYCTDTLYFDKSFTQQQEISDYYEVVFKPGFGAIYNQKRKNYGTSYMNPYYEQYWVNEHMIGYYNIIDGNPIYLVAKNDMNYKSIISDFFNDNLLVDAPIIGILNRNGLKKYNSLVNIIVSKEGDIDSIIIPPGTSRQLSKFKDSEDLKELNELIYNKMLGMIKMAPKAKPASIEKRLVDFQYSIWITIEI